MCVAFGIGCACKRHISNYRAVGKFKTFHIAGISIAAFSVGGHGNVFNNNVAKRCGTVTEVKAEIRQHECASAVITFFNDHFSVLTSSGKVLTHHHDSEFAGIFH